MFPSFFLQHLGEQILFKTVSSAWICATSSKATKKNKLYAKECKKTVDGNESLDFLIEYFRLDDFYDGEKIKNLFNYKLKKYLK